MAEQKLTSLEQSLLKIANFSGLAREINKSKNADEVVNLQNILHQELCKGMDVSGLTKKEKTQAYNDLLDNITQSREESYRIATDAVDIRQETIKKDYETNQKNIVRNVVSAMNANLKDAQSKAHAGDMIARYFTNLVDVPDVDQANADQYAREDLAQRAGLSRLKYARGNPETYKKFLLRQYALEYVKEKKQGDKVSYEVDEKKIAETMKEVTPGAMLYGNSFAIAAEIKKAKDKAAKKAKGANK